MNNTAKKILMIIMIILFICSTLFNVLCFNSSYTTLLVKYDEDLYYAMHSSAVRKLTPDALITSKNSGLQVKTTGVGTCKEATLDLHFDNESKPTLKFSCTKIVDDVEKTGYTYYSDGYFYLADSKIKAEVSFEDVLSIYTVYIPSSFIIDDDAKTLITFDSKYLIGIKYSYSTDDSVHTYKYDLNSHLRSVKISNENDKVTEYTLTYKNEKVSLPDFSEYR